MTTLNTTRAGELLCVHPKTIERLILDGTLPAAKIGRSWVLTERDVLDYLERQIVAQTQRRRLGDARPRRAA
jgi:excisionase family DNA binding protein